MQEIIQNADDAGAKMVKFFIDSREHGTTSLVHRNLAPYQGPALLAYNDAQFRDEDWEGIQNLQRSVKAEDPFKVGKFGIGFNSIYHITGSYSYYTLAIFLLKRRANAVKQKAGYNRDSMQHLDLHFTVSCGSLNAESPTMQDSFRVGSHGMCYACMHRWPL